MCEPPAPSHPAQFRFALDFLPNVIHARHEPLDQGGVGWSESFDSVFEYFASRSLIFANEFNEVTHEMKAGKSYHPCRGIVLGFSTLPRADLDDESKIEVPPLKFPRWSR